ncbi:MAG: hypothetical protein II842_07075 [Butyrivibrio sp.]|nr:hypothetical protein [Butyrivibrio sp.]
MISEVANISFSGDIIHVTIYANIVAIMLTLGVLVLCSRGIIRDPFENKIFKWMLIAAFCLSIADALAFAGIDVVLPKFISMLIQTLNELLINAVVILWLFYVNYRMYRSRDFLKRSFCIKIIPLFIIVILTVLNLFFGFLFYIDENHVWHVNIAQGCLETIRFIYVIACIIQVTSHKKNHRDFKFFEVAGFVIPMVAGTLYTNLSPYSVIALGFAIGLTNIYASIINEVSFLDRDTGYYNRFYLKYLEKDICDGTLDLKSSMFFHMENSENAKEFAEFLNPLLPKKCEMIRLNPSTLIMLAEVSDKMALRMMEDDVVDGLMEYKTAGSEEIIIHINTYTRKVAEPPLEFFETLISKVN